MGCCPSGTHARNIKALKAELDDAHKALDEAHKTITSLKDTISKNAHMKEMAAKSGRETTPEEKKVVQSFLDPMDTIEKVDLSAHVRKDNNNWAGICGSGNLFVAAPMDSDHLLVFNSLTSEKQFIDITSVVEGPSKFAGIAYGEGLFVCSPGLSQHLLVYRPEDGKFWGLNVVIERPNVFHWAGIGFGGGIFVCSPHGCTRILVYCPNTDMIRYVELADIVPKPSPGASEFLSERHPGFADVAYSDGCFVFPPFVTEHPRLMVYCPKRVDEVRLIDVADANTSCSHKDAIRYTGIAFGEGLFVCCPRDADDLLVYRPKTDETWGIDITTLVKSGTKHKCGGIAYGEGIFVCVGCNLSMLLIYRVSTKEVFGVNLSSLLGEISMGHILGIAYDSGLFVTVPWNGHKLLFFREENRRREESQRRGVSLAYIFTEFKQKAEHLCSHDPTFHELKPLVYGQKALGYDTPCPRDGRTNCSMVDALSPTHRSGATHFLSWVWSYKLSTVQSALHTWMKRNKLDANKTYLWMCFACNNQFRIFGEMSQNGSDNLDTVFESRLKAIGTMVALLDDWRDPIYNKRIWTQFEQYTAMKLQMKVELILPRDRQISLQEEMQAGNMGNVITALGQIDSEEAKASVEDDELKVKRIIRSTVGFNLLNDTVKASMVQCCARQFQKILETQIGICEGESVASLQSLAHVPRSSLQLRFKL